MKVIEPNPIIWGYRRGYGVAEIADGLGIPDQTVRKIITDYEERRAVAEIMLRSGTAEGGWSRMGNWKREVLGARAALAAIEAEKMGDAFR
jgi:predicted transcriptional regulator